MKRDWKTIKDLLEAVEQNKIRCHWEELKDDETRRLVLLHYELLQESGLIVNYSLDSDFDDSGKITYHPCCIHEVPNVQYIHLTMAGYDLLEVLRDHRLWNTITNKAKNLSVKLTWEFIKQAVPIVYKSLL